MKRSWKLVRRRSTLTPLSTMSITLKGYLQSQLTCSAINYSISPCLARSFYPSRYCSVFDLDPCETLKQCGTARIEVFLHWMLKDIQHQEDWHGDNILASIKPALYRLDSMPDRAEHDEADLCGMTSWNREALPRPPLSWSNVNTDKVSLFPPMI